MLRIGDPLGIERRTTPWTAGQVKRMNPASKKARVKRVRDDDYGQLGRHHTDFISSNNFGRRVKALKGLMPGDDI